MTNDLLNLKKNLKSFAKRCKDFKYTDSALLAFLLSGMLISTGQVFAETVTNSQINNQVSQINTSINQMRTDFKRARAENNKLIKDTNLELTQLMEQGDHVTKSPWSSWQFGANGFYSDWHGTYKGKGNKISNIIYKRDQTLNKYIAKPVSEKNANNTTLLGFAYEPNAEIPISASITPKSISKVNPNIKKNVTIAGLPSFEPRVVKEPLAPDVSEPVIPEAPDFGISASSSGNNTGPAFDDANTERVMDGIAITGGDFYIKRNNANNWTYYYTGYTGKNAWYNAAAIANGTSVPSGGTLPASASSRGSSAIPVTSSGMINGFQRLVTNNATAGTMLSNGKFLYSRTGSNNPSGRLGEFAHLDLHGGADVNDQLTGLKTAASGLSNENLILNAYGDALSKVNSSYTTASIFSGTGNSLTATTAGANAQTWINSGTIIGEGSNISITNSYDHDRQSHHRAVVINTGDITLQPYEDNGTKYEAYNAGFVVSNDIHYHSPSDNSDPRQQTLYNAGNMTSYTKTTAMFFLDSRDPRPIITTNRGKVKMYGETSVGVYVKKPEILELSFTGKTDGTSINSGTDYNPIELFGDRNIGLFIPNTGTSSNVTGTFAVNIGDTAGTSNTLFSSTSTQGAPITNYDINSTNGRTTTIKTYSKNSYITKKVENTDIQGSAGIYSYGSLDLQGHQIRIYDKTDGNVGVYSADSGVVYNLGDGTMLLNKGKNNTAIAVGENKGKVISKSEITLTDGVGNVGIYAATAGSKRTGTTPTETVTAKSITSTGTVNSIGIYADKGAYVELSDGISMKSASVSNDPIKLVTDSNGEKFGGENSGAVYATGSNTKVVIDQANKQTSENIDINGKEIVEISAVDGSKKKTGDYAGFGLYADGGAIIEAKNNYVKVTNGGTAVASTGSPSSEVNLNQGTVEYDGKGYALYSKNGGQIKLTSGKLILKGEATGFSVDASVSPASQPVKLTGSTVDMQSDDAILMSIKNANSLKTTGIAATLLGYSGLNPTDVSSSNGKNYYKIAVLDKSKIDIDGAGIDKSDATTGSDSEVFTRRLLIQNSILDVSSKVMAHLNKSQITAIDSNLTVPVGLAISASENSVDTTTTGVNVKNGATISVDRTDSGNGGVGAYVNYGKVHNEGKIEVEKTTPNDHAVGIYATNGTEVNNDTTGTVEVGGKDSIGILGLSYRIDSKGNVVYEKFGTTGTTKPALISAKIGLVDVKNSGKITLDGDNSLGIYAKNNSVDATGTNADYLRDSITYTNAANDGEITMTGKNVIGMIVEGGIATNDTKGKITISGQEGVAMYGTAITGAGMAGHISGKIHSELNNKGTIDLADTTTSTPIIGMFTNDADTDIFTSGTINVGKKSYGIYGVSNKVEMTNGTINVGDDGVGIFATGSSDSEAGSIHSDVNLTGGTINVGNNQAVGVFIADDATNPLKTTVYNTGTNMTVGTNAFGYVVDSKTGTELNLGANSSGATNTLTASIGTDSVYAYTNDKTGSVFSNTNITTTGGKSYGIYAAGEAVNYGTIDLTGGTGNVGIYSTGTSASGVGATNRGVINVGSTNVASKEYGIGMATGYYNETTGAISNEGLIENRGTINVLHENSIGMYAVGSGSKAINHAGATIDISGKNATGMYIDQGAEGINYGTIKSTGSAKGIKGVATVNGGYIKNYGTISITSPDGIGIYQDAASALSQKNVPGNVSGTKANVYSATSTDQKYIVTPKGTLLI